jgi:hypothetical protein
MRRLDRFLKSAAVAVGLPLALAAATIVDWLVPVRIEVSPDGRLVPTR